MARFFAWMKRVLASPRALHFAVAMAVLLSLPSITTGISADDYWHKLAFTKEYPDWAVMKNPWWNLFRFFDGDGGRNQWLLEHGITPWWSDPDVRAIFFRPLSCATHALDYRLWPESPVLMHLHSVAWYALLVAVAGWTYRRLFTRLGDGSPWIANLAALLYALDYSHGLPVAWCANRNAVVAGVFAVAALGMHDVAACSESSGARRRAVAIASALLFLGLCAGESALAITAYLAAYTWWLDDRPLRARAISFLPYVGATLVWLAIYRLGGFGVKGSGMYIEPLREPVAYGMSVLQSLPLLVAAELGAPAPDLYTFAPFALKVGMLAFALAFLAWSSFAFVRLWKTTPLARVLLGGSVLAVLPGCATFASARLLVIPSFGLIGVLAVAFAGLVDDAAWIPEGGAARKLVRSYVVWSGLGHLFISPLAFQVSAQQIPIMGDIVRRLAKGMNDADPIPERIVIVNSPDTLFFAFLLIDNAIHYVPAPKKMLSLAAGARDLRVTRDTASSLVVDQDDGFYRVATEVIMRKPTTPMPKGSTVDLDDVQVEVLETTPDGIANRAVFRFREPIDDPKHYAFRAWTGAAMVPFPLPAVGETVVVKGHFVQLTP